MVQDSGGKPPETKIDKHAAAHRDALQAVVSSLGRDDIAVGEVAEVNGHLRFTLTRSGYTHQDQIPLEVLSDRERARAALMAIIPKISKPVEQQHIDASKTS